MQDAGQGAAGQRARDAAAQRRPSSLSLADFVTQISRPISLSDGSEVQLPPGISAPVLQHLGPGKGLGGFPKGIESLKIVVQSTVADAFVLSKLVGASGSVVACIGDEVHDLPALQALVVEWTRDVCGYSSANLTFVSGHIGSAQLPASTTSGPGTSASAGEPVFDLCLMGGVQWPSVNAAAEVIATALALLRNGGELMLSTTVSDR